MIPFRVFFRKVQFQTHFVYTKLYKKSKALNQLFEDFHISLLF